MPRNPAVITFDDGYRDNHDEALPVLQRHRAPATFFVSTRYVSGASDVLVGPPRSSSSTTPGSAGVVLRYPESIELDLTSESGRAAAAPRSCGS